MHQTKYRSIIFVDTAQWLGRTSALMHAYIFLRLLSLIPLSNWLAILLKHKKSRQRETIQMELPQNIDFEQKYQVGVR